MPPTHLKLFIRIGLPFILGIWFFVPSAAKASPRLCGQIFSPALPDLLAKSGLQITDIKIRTFHYKENRVWIELQKSDNKPIGRIALWPGGRGFFHIEIALLEEGYEGKGLGFLLYQAAAHVASVRYNRVLSAGRDTYTPDAEMLWQKMLASGAAGIRYLPLLQLVNYLNEITPLAPTTPENVSWYVERFGQSIYVMRPDSAAAQSFRNIYDQRGHDIINTE